MYLAYNVLSRRLGTRVLLIFWTSHLLLPDFFLLNQTSVQFDFFFIIQVLHHRILQYIDNVFSSARICYFPQLKVILLKPIVISHLQAFKLFTLYSSKSTFFGTISELSKAPNPSNFNLMSVCNFFPRKLIRIRDKIVTINDSNLINLRGISIDGQCYLRTTVINPWWRVLYLETPRRSSQ